MHHHAENCILPGAVIGILGGGQLGRMIALEGRKMGYRFVTLDPTEDSPCGQVCDEQIVANYDNVNAAKEFAALCNVITYEFENVDAKVAEVLETISHVPQGSKLLYMTQHRVREKSTLRDHGIPVTPFRGVARLQDLLQAGEELGYPCVLKTCTGGYDGKGQWLIPSEEEAKQIWAAQSFSSQIAQEAGATKRESSTEQDFPMIVEQFVRFQKELSVVVARNRRGEIACFPMSENIHRQHILHQSIVPARVADDVHEKASQIARHVAKALDVIGLIAIELFLTDSGELYINELAPRPHNSGHYTSDACMTSQFEQHLRAICNLPLGNTNLLTPVVMVNILGEHVDQVLQNVASFPGNVKLHLYGKHACQALRKMGHLNVLAKDVEQALLQIDKMGIWETK